MILELVIPFVTTLAAGVVLRYGPQWWEKWRYRCRVRQQGIRLPRLLPVDDSDFKPEPRWLKRPRPRWHDKLEMWCRRKWRRFTR